MTESKSRYSIMEELNQRKINQREKLANIEREYDNKKWELEQEITGFKDEIDQNSNSYESIHTARLRELEVANKLFMQEYERKKTALKDSIDDEKKNYKQRFQMWKQSKQNTIAEKKQQLERYIKDMEKKIKDKQEIIDEIEDGIQNLKDMSKEQKPIE